MQVLNNHGTPCSPASEMRHTLYPGDVYAGGTSRSRIESKLGGVGDRFR